MKGTAGGKVSFLKIELAELIHQFISRFGRRLAAMVLVSDQKRALAKEKKTLKGFAGSCRQGVNLVGYLRAEMGLGQVARGVAMALEAAEIPFNIVNFAGRNRAPQRDMSWERSENSGSDFDVTILIINPDNIFNARIQLSENLFAGKYVIAYWFWELPEIPDEWVSAFSLVDEVWAASRFVQEAIARRSPVPVMHVPAVVCLQNHDLTREDFNLPPDSFLFLTTCDAASIVDRKNPVGVIDAFQAVFDKNDLSVGLVLKLSGPWHLRSRFTTIRQRIQYYDNIYVFDQPMTRKEFDSLISSVDCFVSLHRAEGFGLPPAEAMSLGKPAIMTNWSGNTDYMTGENSIGIEYRLVKLERDYGPYAADQYWAEPNIDQAADWMEKLVRDPELAHEIGARGQKTIEQLHSPAVVGHLILKRLATIREVYLNGPNVD